MRLRRGRQRAGSERADRIAVPVLSAHGDAPNDKCALIADLFEKIVFYDKRVTGAKAVKRADGQRDVTMKLHLA